MKFLSLLIFVITFSIPAFAFVGFGHKLNLDCLEGSTSFAMPNYEGEYADEPFFNITFYLRANGKYLILDTEGPHFDWSLGGVTLLLRREKDYYINRQAQIKITPFCEADELFMEFGGSDRGGAGVLYKKMK